MGKSSSPPPAPDYTGAAQATAQGNIDAAKAAAEANRVNQVTPYGNLQYSQDANGGFDQAGFDQAMQDYQSKYNAWHDQRHSLNPGSMPVAPDRAKFTKDPTW